ncbi:MAG TPA: sigma-54 dependent transcriptional regulator [Blastocatellia bacterium]|nr:sigma-54 dependent transcriptional regulator [Blastocatellia bacterium]
MGFQSVPTQQSVLVIDDDETILNLLQEFLQFEGYIVETASSAEEALQQLRQSPYDAIITDLNLPALNGTDVVRQALKLYPDTAIFVITGAASIRSAVHCIRMGAYDFIPKPFELAELRQKLADALCSNRENDRTDKKEIKHIDAIEEMNQTIIGNSETMRELYDLVDVVARSNSTVLITGETGTGKELVARALHRLSNRANGKMVSLNCAAIPENLLEDELFGHVKGAYTGAQTNRAGRFEQAHMGTLFLDEVGYMSPALQVKLLRVLQEREFERLGGTQTIKCDVRVIAATSSNLEGLVNEGTFRRDLFYRLNVIPIHTPSLCQRREDVPLLANHFTKKFCAQLQVDPKTISPLAIKKLMSYDWPGNVRELENVIERAVVLSRKREQIMPSDFPLEVQSSESSATTASIKIPEEGISFDTVVSNIERDLILQSLQRTGGNKSLAAELLRMKRTTLIEKLKRLNLQSEPAEELVSTGT